MKARRRDAWDRAATICAFIAGSMGGKKIEPREIIPAALLED